FDQRLEVSQQRSRVGRLDRGDLFAPRDDGIGDEGGFRGPAAIERSFAGMGPRGDLVHAQSVVAELRETLERGAQDRRIARPIEAPAAASDPASCRRFVMVGHDLYDTEPYRTARLEVASVSMIEVERVAKRFGATQALADVDLFVAEGKVLALL